MNPSSRTTVVPPVPPKPGQQKYTCLDLAKRINVILSNLIEVAGMEGMKRELELVEAMRREMEQDESLERELDEWLERELDERALNEH